MTTLWDLPRETRDLIWDYCLDHENDLPAISTASADSLDPDEPGSPPKLDAMPPGIIHHENIPCCIGLVAASKRVYPEVQEAIERKKRSPGGFPRKLDILVIAPCEVHISHTSCLWNAAAMPTMEVNVRHYGFLDDQGDSRFSYRTCDMEEGNLRREIEDMFYELNDVVRDTVRSHRDGVPSCYARIPFVQRLAKELGSFRKLIIQVAASPIVAAQISKAFSNGEANAGSDSRSMAEVLRSITLRRAPLVYLYWYIPYNVAAMVDGLEVYCVNRAPYERYPKAQLPGEPSSWERVPVVIS